VDKYSYGNGSLGSGYGNDKHGEKQTLGPTVIYIPVEYYQVDIYSIQHELNTDQHCYQVLAGEETVNPDKEEHGADD
jgi:hypothetical protein